jgi:hypothetical protein
MSGHGKSNAAADLVEDVLDNHAQVIIIEPIPEWHTLKARYNNVVVVGGPYQDLPLEPAFAHEYVKSALEKGISLVVNVSDIEDEADQIKFVSSFLWNLYRLEQKYRRVLFLVLEEADTWAPQNWDAITKQSLSRVSLIAKHGRKIGIFPILISQRPADLHKSPLSQCNINLFGKFTSPADLSEKTGIMYVVKKLHLQINEEQIMKLENGSFVVSDKNGVHTVAVRKRLCPHGADTPLIEPKPFTADLSRALGGLRDEIAKAVAAKKDEESAVKRLEKEIAALRRTNEDLQEKANIKLSVKEMLSDKPSPPGFEPGRSKEDKESKEKLEKYVEFLELKEKHYKEQLDKAEKDLKAYDELRTWLRIALGIQNIYDNIHRVEEKIPVASIPQLQNSDKVAIGLQKVFKIVDVPEVKKQMGPFPTDTVKGKILAVAEKGKLDTWRQLGEVVKFVEEEHWNASTQEVNNALNDLAKEDLIAKKHTDRNYYCLAQGVVFEGKKEAS